MNDLEDFGFRGPNELGRRAGVPGGPQPRAVGSPLPVGSGSPSPLFGVQGDSQSIGAPPGRALANPNPTPSASLGDLAPTLQWAANALRSVGPFVQKILPLLDGNIATAVSNVLAQHPQPHPPSARYGHGPVCAQQLCPLRLAQPSHFGANIRISL